MVEWHGMGWLRTRDARRELLIAWARGKRWGRKGFRRWGKEARLGLPGLVMLGWLRVRSKGSELGVYQFLNSAILSKAYSYLGIDICGYK
jgi:hypothetical protein